MNNTNGGLSFNAYITTADFKKGMKEMEQAVLGMTRSADRSVSGLEGTFKQLGAMAAGAFAFSELAQLPGKIVQVRGEFQQLEIAFTTMLKSKAKADQLMAEVVQLAATTPFGLKDAAAATKQLLAYGSASTEVIGELRMLGDVAAGVGAPIGDLAYLYGTLRTQGKAMTVDIRQFAGRGIPIYEELAKVLKINTEEVASFVEAGKVGFKDVQQAFKNMSGEGGTFQNLMAEQSKSLTGLTSQFADAVEIMFNDLGRSQEGALATIIKSGTSIVENYQKVLDILYVLIATYGVYQAVVYATAAIQSTSVILGNIQAWLSLAKTITSAKDAQILFNLASSANPYALAIAAIAGLVTIYSVYSKELTETQKAMKLLDDSHKKAEDSATSEIAKIEVLRLSIKNEKLSREERNKKLQELIALSPKHLSALNLDNIATNEGTAAIDSYIGAMKRKIEIQEIEAGLSASLKKQAAAERGENELGFFDRLLIAGSAGESGMGDVQKRGEVERKKINSDIVKEELKIQEQYKTRISLLNDIGAEVEKSGKKETAAIVKNAVYYDGEIKRLKEEQEKKATNRKENLAYQKQIDTLQRAKDRITGGKAEKVAEKDKPQPFGSIAYYEQVAQKADEILKKTPSDNFGKLKALNKIKTDAENEAEKIRSQFAVKSFDDELDEKRTRYENYQKWVSSYGEEVAKKNYEDLVAQGTSYASYLSGQIKKLEDQEKMPGIGLDGIEKSNLIKLKVEYDEITNAETPLKRFNDRLINIRDTSQSLTEEIERLSVLQLGLPTDMAPDSIAMRQQTKQQLIEATNARKANLQEFLVSVAGSEDSRLQIEKRYQDLRKALDERFLNNKGESYKRAMDAINQAQEKAFEEEARNLVEQSVEWKALAKVIENSRGDETKLRVDALRGELAYLKANGKEKTEIYAQTLRAYENAEEEHKQKSIRNWSEINSVVSQLGATLEDMPGTLGQIGGVLSGLAGQFGNISKAYESIKITEEKTTISAGGYVAAAQAVIGMVNTMIQSNKKRHEDEKAFAIARIGFEEDYQLALNQSVGQSYKKEDNIFTNDIEAKIQAGAKQYQDAQEKFQTAIEKLNEGQAKVRQKNAVDGKTVGQMAGAGATFGLIIGAAVGVGIASVVTGAIGAAIGGAVGAIVGLFAKKKKDVFGDLMTEYPELVKEGADGWKTLNVEMAKSLIVNGQVDEKTKQLLETAIAYNDELEKSSTQIKEGLSELVGGLGDQIRDALVTAFKDGTDAAEAFGKAVGGIIGDMVSKLLFVALFKDAFAKLEKDMISSYGINGDQSIVDDLGLFFQENKDKPQQYVDGLAALNEELEKMGFTNAMGKNSGSGSTGLKGAIQGMSEETAGLLAGQFNALRIYSADTNAVVKLQLIQLQLIAVNTAYNKNLLFMPDVVDEIRNLNKTSIRGFGL